MNISLVQDLKLWLQDANLHERSALLKRLALLIPESLIKYDQGKNRYYFINTKGQVQFGLRVNIDGIYYLMIFIQLKFILDFVQEAIELQKQFEMLMLASSKYDQLQQYYSLGHQEYEPSLILDYNKDV